MRLKGYLAVVVAAALVLPAGGCMRPWRPPQAASSPASDALAAGSRPTATRYAPTASDYLRAWRRGRWVYQRREITEGDAPVVDRYVRQCWGPRVSEGTLAGRPLLPLERYLQSPEAPTQQAQYRPQVPLGKMFVVFFEVGEPVDPIPPEVFEGSPVVTTTSLQYFDGLGRPASKGTLTRTAALDGYEEVTCPAGRFERCARVRVDLAVRFPLILSLEWNSYVWLSPEVGEVRRVEQFSGWFVVFWFGCGHEFELESWDRQAGMAPADVPRYWTHGLVHLVRAIPRTRIDGLMVDVVATKPAP